MNPWEYDSLERPHPLKGKTHITINFWREKPSAAQIKKEQYYNTLPFKNSPVLLLFCVFQLFVHFYPGFQCADPIQVLRGDQMFPWN